MGPTMPSGKPSDLLSLLHTQAHRAHHWVHYSKAAKGSKRREPQKSLNISGFYHFIITLQANFIILITVTEEKPEQLTTPEIEVCHRKKDSHDSQAIGSPHRVFSPGRRSASLTFS